MRFAKFSASLTKIAHFKDRRSKIGIRHDGSMLVRLAGKDMEALREEVFERDGCCVEFAGPYATENHCMGKLELSHDIPRGRGGSDTPENTHCRCTKHHRLRDGHGQDLHF